MGIPSSLPAWVRVGARFRRTNAFLYWGVRAQDALIVGIDDEMIHIVVHYNQASTLPNKDVELDCFNLRWEWMDVRKGGWSFDEFTEVPQRTAWERLLEDT